MAIEDAEVLKNQHISIGVVTVCLALSIASFALRIYARMVSTAKLWYDDYWMCWVLLVCIAMSTGDFVGLHFGSGQRQADLPPEMVTSFMLNLYIYMILWSWGVFGVKTGLLLFYWRIFHTRGFRIAATTVAIFSFGIFLAFFFTFTFQCAPVRRFWIEDLEGAKCIDQNAFYNASAIINVVGDVAVLALPLPIVWSLNTSRSKKIYLSFLFLLGAFVCIASVFRIIAVRAINPHDFTFTNVAGGLWSTAEVEIGFICANLPSLRPLMTRWFGIGRNGYSYGSSGTKRSTAIMTSNKGGMGGSRMGHMRLGSRGGNSDPSETGYTKHGNGSDEIELTGDAAMRTIRVDTDVEMSFGDWNGDEGQKSAMNSFARASNGSKTMQ